MHKKQTSHGKKPPQASSLSSAKRTKSVPALKYSPRSQREERELTLRLISAAILSSRFSLKSFSRYSR